MIAGACGLALLLALMALCLIPDDHLAAFGAGVRLALLVYPALYADLLHSAQILYHVLMMTDAFGNMRILKFFQSFTGKLCAFVASHHLMIAGTFSKSCLLYTSRCV